MSQYDPVPHFESREPERKTSALKIVLIILAILGGLTFCCCGGGIVWLVTLPEGGVRTANNMDQYAVDYIATQNLIQSDETIVAYYDYTLNLNGEQAAILTDKRLIYHAPGGNTVILLKDVSDIQHHYTTMIGDVIQVQDTNGQFMMIEIAPLNDGPVFLNALIQQAELNGYVQP